MQLTSIERLTASIKARECQVTYTLFRTVSLGEGHFGTLKNPGKVARAEGVETLTNWFEAENEAAA